MNDRPPHLLAPAARVFPAYAFRSMSPHQAALETALSRVIDPVAILAAGTQVYAAVDSPRAAVTADAWLTFRIAGAAAALQIGWATAARLAGQVLEGGDGADAALVLEDALAPWLDQLEIDTGVSVRFDMIAAAATVADLVIVRSLRINAQASGSSMVQTAFLLHLSQGAATVLAQLIGARVARRGDLPGLRLRAQLVMGRARLTVGELASLAPGDAIVMHLGDQAPHALIVEHCLIAPATQGPDGVRLTGAFQPLPSPDKDTPAMPDPTPADAASPAAAPKPPPADAAVDDIEVQLSFLAGQTLLSLRELRGMTPGAIVHLPMRADGVVQIVVNGRVVGSGEIIDVAGQRAVQIRSLFANE